MASDYKKMLELKQDDWIKACGEIDKLTEQVKMLEKQLEKADECLYFYSVLTDYYMSNDFELYCPEGKSMSGVEKKWGLRARNYFKEKEG